MCFRCWHTQCYCFVEFSSSRFDCNDWRHCYTMAEKFRYQFWVNGLSLKNMNSYLNYRKNVFSFLLPWKYAISFYSVFVSLNRDVLELILWVPKFTFQITCRTKHRLTLYYSIRAIKIETELKISLVTKKSAHPEIIILFWMF